MNYKTILSGIILLAYTYLSNASPDSIRKLSIGDKVPDIELSSVLNYKDQTLRISDFRGKLLILDFWSVHCVPCIAAFPKLHELQDEFGDEIMILPVSFNNPHNEIVAFINKRQGTKYELKLPTAIEYPNDGSVLRQLFPFEGMPHIIWIDNDGILRAVTDHYYLSSENISTLLSGSTINWAQKTHDSSFQPGDVLFQDDLTGSEALSTYFRSVISGYQNGKIGGYTFTKDSLQTKITIVNQGLNQLIKYSLGGTINQLTETFYNVNPPFAADIYNKLLLLEANDPNNRLRRERTHKKDTTVSQWIRENTFCYELILPPHFDIAEALHFMHDDVCRLFRLNVKVETLPIDYLALVRTSGGKDFKSRGMGSEYYAPDNTTLSIKNLSFALFVDFLETYDSPIIIDETGIDYNIDIDFTKENTYNLYSLRESLKPYGLDLVMKNKEMDVLVIADR